MPILKKKFIHPFFYKSHTKSVSSVMNSDQLINYYIIKINKIIYMSIFNKLMLTMRIKATHIIA